MDTVGAILHLIARQDADAGGDATVETPTPACEIGNEYDGRMGLRIAALFIIWATSTIGACFPIFAKRHQGIGVPEWAFFIAKYFGSGVIIATAFIHLLAPAVEALTNECLTGPITDYSWPEGIALMTIFVLFFVELMVMRYADFGGSHDHSGGVATRTASANPDTEMTTTPKTSGYSDNLEPTSNTHTPGADHLGHRHEHTDIEDFDSPLSFENYKAQMTAIFILEFGIIFHSIFIGLTLAVAGSEFVTLFIVIIFHQTFEGLGLGSRLAVSPFPKSRRWTPYIMAVGYGLSTPIAIAIGLGVRESYPPGSQTTLIVNGVFDAISAGILIYTGLVELMAHEFLFSNTMRRASIKTVLTAFGVMCLGAGLMALLGNWA